MPGLPGSDPSDLPSNQCGRRADPPAGKAKHSNHALACARVCKSRSDSEIGTDVPLACAPRPADRTERSALELPSAWESRRRGAGKLSNDLPSPEQARRLRPIPRCAFLLRQIEGGSSPANPVRWPIPRIAPQSEPRLVAPPAKKESASQG